MDCARVCDNACLRISLGLLSPTPCGFSRVSGQETETLVMEEDAQPLEQPIIAPVIAKKFEVEEREAMHMHGGLDFMAGLMSAPHLCCNVAVIGHLHHGKTMIMDMLVKQTHEVSSQATQAALSCHSLVSFASRDVRCAPTTDSFRASGPSKGWRSGAGSRLQQFRSRAVVALPCWLHSKSQPLVSSLVTARCGTSGGTTRRS